MTPQELFDGLRDGIRHTGGIRCLPVFRLADEYIAQLQSELLTLCEREQPSDVRRAGHITNWTRPQGEVLQYSLLNLSGRTGDYSHDHDLSTFGKKFHLADKYPQLAAFIGVFPDLINFRVNVLGPRARLAAHEERPVFRTVNGSAGICIRYHLPLLTNPDAELTLDGHVVHLEKGIIYLVNHGCVHAARNAASERRVHLVWDQLLTREAYEFSFERQATPNWISRTEDQDLVPSVQRLERMSAHIRLAACIDSNDEEPISFCKAQ